MRRNRVAPAYARPVRLRLLAPLLFLALAGPAEAVDVHVGAGGFSAPNVSIQTGDTVRWCWDDPVHTVTSTGGPDQYDTDPGYPPAPPNHTGCSFSHQFNTAGTSTYKDKVTAATAQVTIAARPPGNQPPVASFTTSPNPANTGQTVTFNASASSDPDGSIVRYEWDLDGDGSFEVSGTSPTTTRTYSAAGTFAVTLKVTDSNQPPSFGSASSAITVQGTSGGGGGNKLPGSPPSADDTAPVAAVALNRRSRGRGALRGVRASVSCSEACLVQLALVGRIGHGPEVVLGTSQVPIARAGRARVRVRVANKAAARRFARNPRPSSSSRRG